MKLLHLTLFRICDFGFAKQLRADNGMLMTPCYTGNVLFVINTCYTLHGIEFCDQHHDNDID